jgi:phage protein D
MVEAPSDHRVSLTGALPRGVTRMTEGLLPVNVTDQLVPRGRVLSVKVNAYTVSKLTAIDSGAPLTVRLPLDGFDPYPVTAPIEYE